jgi:hypothetical protein
MSYITKGVNLPALYFRNTSYTWSGYSRGGSIKYYPPAGITIASWKITVFDVRYLYWSDGYYAVSYYINRIKGKFRQYDASDNLLNEVAVDIGRGASQTITAASDVDHVELFITYFEFYRSANYDAAPYPTIDSVNSGTGNEVIRIASLDSSNNETSSLRITSSRGISMAKLYDDVQVISENPVREFSITINNTSPYILEWYFTIDSVTGTTNPDVDKVKVELLDSNKNTLDSTLIPATAGSSGYLTHNPSTRYIRVSLLSTKRIIVVVRVHEAINIAYGIS